MKTNTQPKRPGRPAAPPEAQRKPRSIRLTDAHWQRLMDLGTGWLEFQLDFAPPGTEWMKELRKKR